jgi:flagellar basal body-associated protein FliL
VIISGVLLLAGIGVTLFFIFNKQGLQENNSQEPQKIEVVKEEYITNENCEFTFFSAPQPFAEP